ncbi:hypothetical protein K435DRAFT_690203, partial [Dendrothele bispora CBS 962.96]
LAAQYCDRVRGPVVVYDPNGPHVNLYDVDGDIHFLQLQAFSFAQDAPQRALSYASFLLIDIVHPFHYQRWVL